MGSYGLTWALKNPSKVEKIAILNTPLTVSSPVPGLFKQLRFDSKMLVASSLCQPRATYNEYDCVSHSHYSCVL